MIHSHIQANVPELLWIGVHDSDLQGDVENQVFTRSLLQLTSRDRSKAVAMLSRGSLRGNQFDRWRAQLRFMLYTNIKAEIQIMTDKSSTYAAQEFEDWLIGKIQAEEYL
jgi:DNA topoisomerase VI subunit A